MTFTSRNVPKPSEIPSPIDFEELIDASISKPARYLGNELGTKPHDWEKASVHWALTYPELYEVGASNLGHIILYSILNSISGQLCDRAYLPASDMSQKLREKSQLLFGVETKFPLATFDILGFSLSYELGATNILEMIDLAGLPIYSADRKDLSLDDPLSAPLIFAGGPTATSNPEPFAPFFDFFALGDGEELLPEIGLVVAEGKKAQLSRSEVLLDLAQIPGVYVPSMYEISADGTSIKPKNDSLPKRILRRVASPIPQYGMGLVPHIETVHDRLTIEIRRGCTRGCRFCQPGMLTRPARDVEPEEVINAVHQGMRETGYSDFSLLSLSCSDYLSLPAVGTELRNQLADKQISLQLPSQRVDRFDENIAHILGGTRQSGLTFAPEAGTQRLRDIVNKGLTDEELLRGIRTAMQKDFRKIKLYFMIGLPGETDEDVIGIVETCRILQNKCKDLGQLKLNITISNFTPKPHTPFQWHSVSTKEFERKQSILKAEFKALKRVKVNYTDVRLSAIEDFLGRGNRKIAEVIEGAWRNGAGMDAWFETIDKTYLAWTNAISEAGLIQHYRKLELGLWSAVEGLDRKDLFNFCSQPLPWDHIDTGIEKKWLVNDLLRALKAQTLEDCSFESCSSCGVCGEDLGENIVIPPPLQIPTRIPQKSLPSSRVSRVRLKFSKTHPISLISHLDLVRMLERALRRSGLPVSYSNGFHPLPRLQIALALPLGVEAFGEWMDIEFTEVIKSEKILEKLQAQLPSGIRILSAKNVLVKQKSLSQELAEAHWSFKISNLNKEKINHSELDKAIKKIKDSKTLIWNDKDKKGRLRVRDYFNELKNLHVRFNVIKKADFLKSTDINSPLIYLESRIDTLGRSIKPNQIKYWLEKDIGKSLEITSITRDELFLFEC